jgi:hypothetical protein
LKINANAISRDGWGFLREFQLSSALGLGAGLPLVIENVFDGYCGYFGAFLTGGPNRVDVVIARASSKFLNHDRPNNQINTESDIPMLTLELELVV